MNKTTIIAMSAVFVASILTITAFEAEAKPPQSNPACPAENVQHWQTVHFRNVDSVIELVSDTNPTLPPNTSWRINIQTGSDEIYDTFTVLLEKLEALGYHMRNINTGEEFPPDQNSQVILDASPSETASRVICAE